MYVVGPPGQRATNAAVAPQAAGHPYGAVRYGMVVLKQYRAPLSASYQNPAKTDGRTRAVLCRPKRTPRGKGFDGLPKENHP